MIYYKQYFLSKANIDEICYVCKQSIFQFEYKYYYIAFNQERYIRSHFTTKEFLFILNSNHKLCESCFNYYKEFYNNNLILVYNR